MPSVTPLYDADSLFNLLDSVETAVALSLAQDSRPVGEWRRIVGWSEPPQDCCPEIAVWGGNLRSDPSSQLAGMSKAVCARQWLFDISIRVSECYIDVDEKGEPLPADTIEQWSKALYRMMHQTYFGFICRWINNDIKEINACTPTEIGSTIEHGDGGCGGFTFVVTVMLNQ